MRFVTDTHCLVWYLQDNARLTEHARALFEPSDIGGQVIIPVIVLAELLHISRKVSLPVSFPSTLRHLQQEPQFAFCPLTLEILETAIPFRKLEMHDALIVATARHLQVPLLTCDRDIQTSKLVQTLRP